MNEIEYKMPCEKVKEGFKAAEGRLRSALEGRNLILAYAIAFDMRNYFRAFDLHNAADALVKGARGAN